MEDSIIKEELTILRSSQKNDVLNDKEYDITTFTSKQGKKVAYFEDKIKETKE